MQGYKKIL